MDLDELNERHRRRIMLMREMGKANRMEAIATTGFIVAGVLAAIAIIMFMLTSM